MNDSNPHADSAFGNAYDLSRSFAFFKRWYKLLTIVFVVALIVSILVSFLITPLYMSTTVFFPANSNRISKSLMDTHYSLDFMDYGRENDCEYALQLLSSQAMKDAVCQHFDLMHHYGIADDDPHRLYEFDKMYKSYIDVRRTDYLGVKISVQDPSPRWAADIANYIAEYYDTLCRSILHSRAVSSAEVMDQVCANLQRDLISLQDSLRAHPSQAAVINQLIADKSNQLATQQTIATQRRVDLNNDVTYKFWIDRAKPADKHCYPKRIIIAILGSFGALALAILLLLLFAPDKNEEKK